MFEFEKMIEVDPDDGEVSFLYKENDPWFGTGAIYVSLEKMKAIVAFAEDLVRKRQLAELRTDIERPSPL